MGNKNKLNLDSSQDGESGNSSDDNTIANDVTEILNLIRNRSSLASEQTEIEKELNELGFYDGCKIIINRAGKEKKYHCILNKLPEETKPLSFRVGNLNKTKSNNDPVIKIDPESKKESGIVIIKTESGKEYEISLDLETIEQAQTNMMELDLEIPN